MPNLMLTWQVAALVAAAALVVGWLAVRLRWIRFAPFARETGIILALYALWQLAGGLSLGRTSEAVHRGQWLWRHERAWHLPSERHAQDLIIHHPLLVQFANIYYDTMHFGVLIAMLLWLFIWHRSAYPRVRTTIVLTTSACLLIALVPVAPPRLIHVGMIDTATAYGQSVYAAAGLGADQYSAMPSVHVAWASLVAVAVITVSTSRWRWLILLHTAATIFFVAATANHFWMDGIVSIVLLALALGVQALSRRLFLRARAAGSPRTVDVVDEVQVDQLDDANAARTSVRGV